MGAGGNIQHKQSGIQPPHPGSVIEQCHPLSHGAPPPPITLFGFKLLKHLNYIDNTSWMTRGWGESHYIQVSCDGLEFHPGCSQPRSPCLLGWAPGCCKRLRKSRGCIDQFYLRNNCTFWHQSRKWLLFLVFSDFWGNAVSIQCTIIIDATLML